MKLFKWLLLTLFIVSFSLECAAQAELGRPRRGLKKVDEARSLAITNTVLATGTGLLAASIFEGSTLKKAAGYLAIYGLMVGPSTGNFYAEDYTRGGFGALARAAAGIWLLKDATREVLGKNIEEVMPWEDEEKVKFADTKIWVGTTIVVGSAIYNFISAKQSVEEHNARLGYRFSMSAETVYGEPYPVFTARINF